MLENKKDLNIVLPFKWRIQNEGYDKVLKKQVATCFAYIDSREVSQVLDNEFGYDNWTSEFYSVNGSTYCKIGIWSESKKCFVYKSDSGDSKRDYLVSQFLDLATNPQKHIEYIKNLPVEQSKYDKATDTPEQVYIKAVNKALKKLDNISKSDATDSFKRSAVQLGIGRFLYSLDEVKLFVKDYDIVDSKGTKLCNKSDNVTISKICNSQCGVPLELINEINSTVSEKDLSEIWFRMYNLHSNSTFKEIIQTKKTLIKQSSEKT